MAPRKLVLRLRSRVSEFALSLPLAVLLGCASAESNPGGTTGGAAGTVGQSGATGGQPPTGGQNSTGGQSATGGQSGGGQSATGGIGGQSASGGQNPSGGQSGSVGSAGGGAGGTGGQSGGAPSGGAGAGATSGGEQSGGGGGGAGAPMGGASGAGGAPNVECTRALLDGIMDDYLEALSAGDPSSLPLAANVKFTENAQESELGMTAFWMNAGDSKHSQRALDTETCSVAAHAVIPEGATDRPVALRLRVENGLLTEIETIVVRPGDYTASFAVDSEPERIIDYAEDIGWHDEVPEAERATRAELAAWIDKYFRAFPNGVCNVTSECRRLENGGGNFSCAATCSSNIPSTPVFEPRVIVVDEVRGIAAGLTIFDFQSDGHLDMHMMKMSGGEVHAVHAILRDTNGESGWD